MGFDYFLNSGFRPDFGLLRPGVGGSKNGRSSAGAPVKPELRCIPSVYPTSLHNRFDVCRSPVVTTAAAPPSVEPRFP